MWQIAHKVKLPTGVMEGSGVRWYCGALLRNCTGSTRSLSEAKAQGLQLPLEDTTTVTPCEQAYCPGVQTQACQGSLATALGWLVSCFTLSWSWSTWPSSSWGSSPLRTSHSSLGEAIVLAASSSCSQEGQGQFLGRGAVVFQAIQGFQL